MAEQHARDPKARKHTYSFSEVFEQEIEAINERRRALGRSDLAQLEIEQDPERPPIKRPTEGANLVGLALSGGGIRSASFCLGALQALDKGGVLKNVDYLSTVSGGGYIGSSLSAAMTHARGEFPFKSSLSKDEPYAIQHIRNHSNYLFPPGGLNIFYNIAIYLRGLVANALLILPWLLIAAAITIFIKPNSESLHVSITWPVDAGHFGVTQWTLGAFGLLLLAWALWRSLELSGWAAEIGSRWTYVCAGILLLLALVAFCELQPLILDGVFRSANQKSGFVAGFAAWIQGLAAVLAPFAAVVALLSRHIGRLLKQGDEKPTLRAAAMRVAGKAAVYVAGAAIPFLLWIAYLYLTFSGMKDDNDFVNYSGSYYHAPQWLSAVAQRWFGFSDDTRHWLGYGTPIGWLYAVAGVTLFALSLMLSPNANSLHRLYRDRLSTAFLFDPSVIEGPRTDGDRFRAASPSQRRPRQTHRRQRSERYELCKLHPAEADELMKSREFELAPTDRFKVSEISWTCAPYHLINAALNIQGSKYANRRGRNADFFIFSPRFTGSSATHYVRTEDFEREVDEFDLATAMAVSGAAASSNMGANSIKALAPTLAILNVRLGYWVINPRQLARDGKRGSAFRTVFDQLYFLQELLGLMREDSRIVYLTDGGHIENLGIYELLRRRCRLIIAIDAEADPDMSFGALTTLQRYARIDLGTLIDLPWAEIRDETRKASEQIARTGGLPPEAAAHGPHCAIGEITYPQNQKGILLYVKSSVTGDENDYIVDYKRRFPAYPHETTADQLFSEEQFEAYRALGFHAVNEMLTGNDRVGMRPKPKRWEGAVLNEPLVKAAGQLLKWT
jgi:predicted acylesterase/phospholipase RssA